MKAAGHIFGLSIFISFISFQLLAQTNVKERIRDLEEKCVSLIKTNRQTEALEINGKILDIIDKNYGKRCIEYADQLMKRGMILGNLRQYDDGIESFKSAKVLTDSIRGDLSSMSLSCIEKIASLYFDKGIYNKAFEYGAEHWKWIKEMNRSEEDDSAMRLIKYCYYSGNYKYYFKNRNNLIKSAHYYNFKTSDFDAEINLYEAEMLCSLGDYVKAMDKANASAKYYTEKSLKNPLYYNQAIYAFSTVGRICNEGRVYAQADEICMDALKLYDHSEINYRQYLRIVENAADTKLYLGQYSEVLEIIRQLMPQIDKKCGKQSFERIPFLNLMATAYYSLNDYDKAISLEEEALKTLQITENESNDFYLRCCGNMIYFHLRRGDYEKVKYYLAECFKYCNNRIDKEFSWMTHNQREYLWECCLNTLYTIIMPHVALLMPDDHSIAEMLFDSELISKGLLLYSDIILENMFEGNSVWKSSTLNSLRMWRDGIVSLNKLPEELREKSADKREEIIEAMERELLEAAEKIGGYTKQLFMSWKDVQQQLEDGDIVIQFISSNSDSENIRYGALLLKKDYDSPHLIPLFEENELKGISPHQHFQDTQTGNLIWGKLKDDLDGVNNVHFIPSGMLHTIPIEYLPIDDGSLMIEKYRMNRLSSARELVLKRATSTKKELSLFGGLEYNMPQSSESASDIQENGVGITPILNIRSISGTLNYLEGAYEEVIGIDKIMCDEWKSHLYTGNSGTEQEFKKLSGKDIKVIHIATHGFYEQPKENWGKDEFSLLGDNEWTKSNEYRSLSRSGLFLSGAQASIDLLIKKIPITGEDGILTAREVSNMNLSNCELVVLSACETGQGELNFDGVYGLQRGFKKAGAHTILMSLWEVNDQATSVLMTEFYKNLKSGKAIYKSFILAQNKIMEIFPDSNDWAAFVLLDALD